MPFEQIYADWDANLHSINDDKAYLLANVLSNGQYKTSEMLRQNEVILATDLLLQKLDYHLDESDIYNFDFSRMDDLKTLLDNTKRYQKPQIIQLSNDRHWITACLLPGGKDGVTVVSMNSVTTKFIEKEVECEHQNLIESKKCLEEDIQSLNTKSFKTPEDIDKLKKLKQNHQYAISAQKQIEAGTYITKHHDSLMMADLLQKTINSISGYENLIVNKLDVEGQQLNNCCGLATSMNSASIIKTFQEDFNSKLPTNSKGEFDVEKFKNANNHNVFYQENEKKQLMIFGQVIKDITTQAFLEKFGGSVLQSVEQQIIQNKGEYLNSLKNSIPNLEQMKSVMAFNAERLISSLDEAAIADFINMSEDEKVQYLVNRDLDIQISDLDLSKKFNSSQKNMSIGEKIQAINRMIQELKQKYDQANQQPKNDYADTLFALKAIMDKEKTDEKASAQVAKDLATANGFINRQEELLAKGQQILADKNFATLESLNTIKQTIQQSGMKQFTALISKTPEIKEILLPEINTMLVKYSESKNIFSLIISYIFGGEDLKVKLVNTLDRMIEKLEVGQETFQDKLNKKREQEVDYQGVKIS